MRWPHALVLALSVAAVAAAQDGTTVNLEPELSQASARPGEVAIHFLELRNPTPAVQSYDLEAASSPWEVTVEPNNVSVGPVGNASIRLTVTIPPDATAGLVRTIFVTAWNTAVTSDVDEIQTNTTVLASGASPEPASETPADETDPNGPSLTDNPSPTETSDENVGDAARGSGARPLGFGTLRFDERAATWATATVSVSSAVGILLLFEPARFRLRLLLFLLFSRLERERVLDHALRDRIYESIRRAPGLHYGGLRRELGVAAGTLAHHLFMLERQELVRSSRDGFRKRYYPRGRADWGPPPLDPVQKAIVDLVQGRPGIHQRAIAAELKLSKQIVSYHIARLSAAGRLVLEREGRVTHCYPARAP